MQGWVKIHRKLMDKPIWAGSTPEQKVLLITLLMMANHKEMAWEWQGEPYEVMPGQFITSLESISRKAGKGISIQNVRTALKRFEKYEFLTNESTNKNRLITIVNWALYQKEDDKITSKPTGDQQATNKQLTTNKNDKNVKNEQEEKTSRSKLKFETHHMKLAELLYREIKANNPSAKEPNLNSWANTFRLMMERPKEMRPGKEIQELILWTQNHSFWYKNILSADKLRAQYDRLLLEMKDDSKGKEPKKLIATEKPAHIEDPILPDDIDEQTQKMIDELYEGLEEE